MLDPIARTIANLIRTRGGEFTMTNRTSGAYNPATSSVSTVVETFTVRGIVFEARESTSANSLIRVGDKQVFIKADPQVPAPDAATGELVYKGKPHRIVWLKELNPSGSLPLMYELFIRG